MMEYSIVLAGFGGQGILSAGRMVAEAALIDEHQVSWFPSYGPEMRGGTANCSVVISDKVIGSPIVYAPDVLIALNQPSLDRFENSVKSQGIIILDSALIKKLPERKDILVKCLPASQIANDLGNMAFAGIALLGCLSQCLPLCMQRDSFEQALKQVLPERKHHMIQDNLRAFDMGYQFVV